MVSALPSSGLVILVDDRKGTWFPGMAEVFVEFGWSCSPSEWFDRERLEGSLNGHEIAHRFYSCIARRLAQEPGRAFAIVSDSEYAEVADAGATLLGLVRGNPEWRARFHRGVVYSTRPKGLPIAGEIELLAKCGCPKFDARAIANFFRTGSFDAERQIVELIARFALFWWPMEEKAFARVFVDQHQERLFRPVTAFGCGDPHAPHASYFCDLVLKEFGSLPVTPFSGATQRWFDDNAYRSFAQNFDPDPDRPEALLPARVARILSPSSSLAAAARLGEANAWAGDGSLRLLMDLILSGASWSILHREYQAGLRTVVRNPRDTDVLWKQYEGVFNSFVQQPAKRVAFTSLWHGAMNELVPLVRAAETVRTRV